MQLDTIVGYVGKYIGKGYEFEQLDAKKSFTANQIKSLYKMSPYRIGELIKEFGKEQAENDSNFIQHSAATAP